MCQVLIQTLDGRETLRPSVYMKMRVWSRAKIGGRRQPPDRQHCEACRRSRVPASCRVGGQPRKNARRSGFMLSGCVDAIPWDNLA